MRIGAYRPDLAIQKVYLKNGELLVGSTVLIECDGHKYHNLTDEQRERDLIRDEEIQRLERVSIIRFRGSEIWRRAADCAARALDALDSVAAYCSDDPVRIIGLDDDEGEEDFDCC